jgi:hypothetical protein
MALTQSLRAVARPSIILIRYEWVFRTCESQLKGFKLSSTHNLGTRVKLVLEHLCEIFGLAPEGKLASLQTLIRGASESGKDVEVLKVVSC